MLLQILLRIITSNALFPCRFRKAEQIVPGGGADRLADSPDKKVPTVATITALQD
jgi:hypothetical protein